MKYKNEIYVYGKKEDLKKFKAEVAGEDGSSFCFERIMPTPEDIPQTLDSHYSSKQLWRAKNWGTMFGGDILKLVDHGSYLYYSFGTKPESIVMSSN